MTIPDSTQEEVQAAAAHENAIALIQVYFRALGLSWHSAPTLAWMEQRAQVSRKEDLSIEALEELTKYLQRALTKRANAEVLLNQVRFNFRRWEDMMNNSEVTPVVFAKEISNWMTQYQDYPECVAEVQRLVKERRAQSKPPVAPVEKVVEQVGV